MDLTNIRKAFDELALSKMDDKILKMNGISGDEELITENLINKREIIEVPFGSIFYSMALEDEKPVLYIEKASRMGSDNLYIIDENGYEEYGIYEGYPPEIKDRYENHLKNIKETKDRTEEFEKHEGN